MDVEKAQISHLTPGRVAELGRRLLPWISCLKLSSVSPTHSVYCSFSIQSLRPIYRTSLQLTQELVRVEEKCTTYPRLVVENCEQIHGIVIVLLSQRAASREEKKKKMYKDISLIFF